MAANCALGPCVQVYTDPTTNKLIISANQNRPGSALVPHPRPIPTHRPTVRPTHRPVTRPTTLPALKPKPRTWIPNKPVRVAQRTYHAPVKKKRSPIAKVATAALSLSDQITRLMPGSNILYQPTNDAVTGIPVYFWSDTNSIFQVATTILGVGVNVIMNPSFTWNFGDGTALTTSSAGGPYPDATITHIYKNPGTYTINLAISWAGSWASQGAVLPVLGGAIVHNATATIQVQPGPTDYTR